jgi:hypothetical protein
MGYFLTAKPENAWPANSVVGPKTHTPLSRLQERGYRYHSANMSRWISRDPLEDLGRDLASGQGMASATVAASAVGVLGRNPYLSFNNAPVDYVDIHGLIEWKSSVTIGYNPEGGNVAYTPIDPSSGHRSRSSSSEQFSHNLFVYNSFTFCNTPGNMYIYARQPCCRKYRITCKFTYLGVARGDDFARVMYSFYVPADNRCEKDFSVGYRWARAGLHATKSCSAVMDIGPEWVGVGRLFPNITMQGGGYAGAPKLKAMFAERGSISCSSVDVGQCN